MNTKKRRMSTQTMVTLALLSAIVAVLAYYGQFLRIGIASISLTLIPIVIGASLYGPLAGAWLGAVSGIVFLAVPSGESAYFFGLSVVGTIITVMAKGILSGLLAGLAYKALARFNRYLAVIVSAIVCPVVNTGVFLLGCFAFFLDEVSGRASGANMSAGAFLIIFWVGSNFIFELLANVIASPAIVRIIDIAKKSVRR